jgi:hypothetical protein
MDTIEQSPVGAEGATSSQDTDTTSNTQSSQPVEGSSETTTESRGEALLAGKYKSPQDLEKAYKELEGKLGDLGQKAKIADVIQERYGVTPQQLQERIEAQEAEAQRQYYANNPLAPVMDEVAQLRQVVERQENEKALIAEERELDGFLKDNPEYQPFRDKILKLGLTSEQDKSYQEIANEWFGQARAQGQQDAYNKIDVKRQSQQTGPSTSKPTKGGYSSLSDLPRSERIKAFENMMGA